MIGGDERPDAPTLMSPAFWLGLLAALVALICAADLSRPAATALLGAIALGALTVGRVRISLIARRLAPLALFGAGVLALLLIAPVASGVETMHLLAREVSVAGLRFLVAILVKGALVIALVTGFAARLDERDFLDGLTGLRLPSKLVGLLYMMLRGLRIVGGETRRLVGGMEARGRPRSRRAAQVAGAMAQTLIVRLGRRAETQALALAARGFDGSLRPATWRPLSALEGLGLAICAGALLWLIR